jgi:ABC-2 type transport system ATP-binding protein
VPPIVSVRGLRMRYPRSAIDVLRGLDLEIRRGEIFAVLGPNGAGKTTTLEILEGHRRRTAGDVSVLGEDPGTAGAAWRGRCGVVLQDSVAEPELTVREVLDLYGGFFDAPLPVDDVLELVGLTAESAKRSAHLSGGQQRRLDVALGIIGDPELLFLDEPTTGFDPAARRVMWDAIRALREERGMTILLTTHALDEAEALADRVAVVVAGEVVAEGPPASLGRRDREPTSIVLKAGGGPAVALPPLPRMLRARTDVRVAAGVVRVETSSPVPDVAALCRWVDRHGLDVEELRVVRPTLEDTYLRLIGAGR